MSTFSPNKPPKWQIYLMLILLGLLFVALYNGCKQNSKLSSQNTFIDSLQFRLKQNKEIGEENKRNFDGALEYANGIIDLRNNRIEEVAHENDSLNNKIAALLKRYNPVTPAVDTNVTVVPNEYVNDCSDCFSLLDNKTQLTFKLRKAQDSLMQAFKAKSNLQENRIKELGVENGNLKSFLSSAIATAQKNQDKLQPRRKMLFSMATVAVNANFPTGIGAGLIYQDKLNRLYGGHVFGSNVGPIYMAQFALPLSLRRSK